MINTDGDPSDLQLLQTSITALGLSQFSDLIMPECAQIEAKVAQVAKSKMKLGETLVQFALDATGTEDLVKHGAWLAFASIQGIDDAYFEESQEAKPYGKVQDGWQLKITPRQGKVKYTVTCSPKNVEAKHRKGEQKQKLDIVKVTASRK